MAKADWGTKRQCASCGAPFYDLNKQPILCPKCGAEFHPEQLLKPRRTRPDEKPVVPKPAPIPKEEPAAEEETAEEELIEDVTELGEDEDDMAEVIDTTEEPDSGR